MSKSNLTEGQIKGLGSVAGVVTVIIVAFYATGLYINYLQIKKLKREGL